MSDKLNCYECKQWFEIKDLVYLPEERFYLCRPCGCMFYAKRSVLLRSELERYETARQEDARRLEQVKGELDAIAESVLTCLKYPRGSEAQIRCLEEVGQDAAALKDAK